VRSSTSAGMLCSDMNSIKFEGDKKGTNLNSSSNDLIRVSEGNGC
jgi:hypothetical protein